MPREKYTITIEKKHAGKIIYAFPTGNNFNRGYTNELLTVEVIKVKRKYATLKIKGREDSYCVRTGATQGAINYGYSMNAGYDWFESEEDYQKQLDIDHKCDFINTTSRGFKWLDKLNIDEIEAIHAVLTRRSDEKL